MLPMMAPRAEAFKTGLPLVMPSLLEAFKTGVKMWLVVPLPLVRLVLLDCLDVFSFPELSLPLTEEKSI